MKINGVSLVKVFVLVIFIRNFFQVKKCLFISLFVSEPSWPLIAEHLMFHQIEEV